jgi:glutaredoxin
MFKVHLHSKPILQWVDYLSTTDYVESGAEKVVPRMIVQSPTVEPVSALEAKIESIISSNNAVIFSKTTCPYCIKAKGIMKGFKYLSVELDMQDDEAEIQAILSRKTGISGELARISTVPIIFIRGNYIGSWILDI